MLLIILTKTSHPRLTIRQLLTHTAGTGDLFGPESTLTGSNFALTRITRGSMAIAGLASNHAATGSTVGGSISSGLFR
jgi:CubicO group peptidase (beta-lactamase class C family)